MTSSSVVVLWVIRLIQANDYKNRCPIHSLFHKSSIQRICNIAPGLHCTPCHVLATSADIPGNLEHLSHSTFTRWLDASTHKLDWPFRALWILRHALLFKVCKNTAGGTACVTDGLLQFCWCWSNWLHCISVFWMISCFILNAFSYRACNQLSLSESSSCKIQHIFQYKEFFLPHVGCTHTMRCICDGSTAV